MISLSAMTDRRKSSDFNLMMDVFDSVSKRSFVVDFHRLLLIRKQKGELSLVFRHILFRKDTI